MTSINRPCCVIPKRECVTFNHTTDIVKRKKIQFWLLTLQNVDRNSWGKISSVIHNLTNTGNLSYQPRQLPFLKNVETRMLQIIMRILVMNQITHWIAMNLLN